MARCKVRRGRCQERSQTVREERCGLGSVDFSKAIFIKGSNPKREESIGKREEGKERRENRFDARSSMPWAAAPGGHLVFAVEAGGRRSCNARGRRRRTSAAHDQRIEIEVRWSSPMIETGDERVPATSSMNSSGERTSSKHAHRTVGHWV